jgi:hypothetical protein
MIDMENNAQSPENPQHDAKLPVSGSLPPDDVFVKLIKALDEYGRYVDSYDYGLPTYEEHIPHMVDICKKVLCGNDR